MLSAPLPSSPYVEPGPKVLNPAQSWKLSCRMKSALSSTRAASEPAACVMQSGALLMIPGI